MVGIVKPIATVRCAGEEGGVGRCQGEHVRQPPLSPYKSARRAITLFFGTVTSFASVVCIGTRTCRVPSRRIAVVAAAAMGPPPPPRKPLGGVSVETTLRPRTKVVVRNLPPGLSKAAFRVAIEKHGFSMCPAKVVWWEYVHGKAKPGKRVTPSVAYLDFVDAETLKEFGHAFHGREFSVEASTPHKVDGISTSSKDDEMAEDDEGAITKTKTTEQPAEPLTVGTEETPVEQPSTTHPGSTSRTNQAACAPRYAQVEYAPNQKTPPQKKRGRKDPLHATAETDAEFLNFVAAIGAPKKTTLSAETLLEKRELAKANAVRKNGGAEPLKQSALLTFLAAQSGAWRVTTGAGASKKNRGSGEKGHAKKDRPRRQTSDRRTQGGGPGVSGSNPPPTVGGREEKEKGGGKKKHGGERSRGGKTAEKERSGADGDTPKDGARRERRRGDAKPDALAGAGKKTIPLPSRNETTANTNTSVMPRVVVIEPKPSREKHLGKNRDTPRHKKEPDSRGKEKEKDKKTNDEKKPPPRVLTRPQQVPAEHALSHLLMTR